MRAEHVDPRDAARTIDARHWRVHFWDAPSRTADEYRIEDVPDVADILDWAGRHAAGRAFSVYVEIREDRTTSLVRVSGRETS